MDSIRDKVADCLVRAGSTFREDQKEAYRKAIADEKNRWLFGLPVAWTIETLSREGVSSFGGIGEQLADGER